MMQELADMIHEEQCDTISLGGCRRYVPDSRHYGYYQQRAQNLIRELEPLIGAANVQPVVKIVLDELGP